MGNLTFTEWVMIISIVLTLISIIIHICVLRALKKATPKSVSEKIGGVVTNLTDTAGKVLKSLNLDGVKDAVNLIKELVTDSNTTPTSNTSVEQTGSKANE